MTGGSEWKDKGLNLDLKVVSYVYFGQSGDSTTYVTVTARHTK